MKLMFVVKNREFPYTTCTYSGLGSPASINEAPFSSGLYNSVRFIVDMLVDLGHQAILEMAIDNNCLDRLITKHRPTHVVLEALWCTPEKIAELKKLHPTVHWLVRLHSEIPFLANEGIAFQWIEGYIKLGVRIMANSPRMCKVVDHFFKLHSIYAPNFYPDDLIVRRPKEARKAYETIDIGCFGAIRPLKNHVNQALAAIKYADQNGKTLNFHINGTRCEGGGEPILKNLVHLFKNRGHNLISHDWYDHGTFRALVAGMTAMMQVSFTETYNIVAADSVSQWVPITTSKEVAFVSPIFKADPTDVDDIRCKLSRAIMLEYWGGCFHNKYLLDNNCATAATIWNNWIEEVESRENESIFTRRRYR